MSQRRLWARQPNENLMTKATTIRSIGNSAGTTIPKAMLQRYS
ncbi:MAG: hypothetical protein QF402_08030 [Candidatus Latescibacteria bacterium]|jgi:hypothetical protein|nr:hypothetical protein [Candidatus Latescibacterota bacterium]